MFRRERIISLREHPFVGMVLKFLLCLEHCKFLLDPKETVVSVIPLDPKAAP